MSSDIQYAVEDGIGLLTLNRPEKRNAMTFEMLSEFTETVRRAGQDAPRN